MITLWPISLLNSLREQQQLTDSNLTGELTNVAAGFGFNGFKEDGSEDWDMINNADIWNVEVCGPGVAISCFFNNV